MPQRSGKRSKSKPLSPPTQLPTPLPDELIDFRVSTPENEPPFELPSEDSPPPLPIPPRIPHETSLLDDDDHLNSTILPSSVGHTRTPVYPRPSYPSSPTSGSGSTLESLTRTIRGYVPSSIHIPVPTAAPSPPLLSRSPVSFGLFAGSHQHFESPQAQRRPNTLQEFERDYERAGLEENTEYYGYSYGYQHPHPQGNPYHAAQHSGLARSLQQQPQSIVPRQPSDLGKDTIVWCGWDTLNDRRIILLGYPSGFQIWDCGQLDAIAELLNINFDTDEWTMIFGHRARPRIVHAGILPVPRNLERDSFARERPILGLLFDTVDHDPTKSPETIFVLYSLLRHLLLKRITFPGRPHSFLSNEYLTVISTITPPSLHLLSSTTFQLLHTIPSASLEPFLPPLPSAISRSTSLSISNAISQITTQSQPVSLPGLSIEEEETPNGLPKDPYPVFALAGRLLAYASPNPASSSPLLNPQQSLASRRLSSSSSTTSGGTSSLSSSPFTLGIGRVTQADIGQAALKVGETVFSGMKYLGGMALDAAKGRTESLAPAGRVGAGFVSRSAPDPARNNPSVYPVPWSRSDQSVASSEGSSPHHPISSPASSSKQKARHVMVVDILPLFNAHPSTPEPVHDIQLLRNQPLANLSFSVDGTTLAIVPQDGHSAKLFKLCLMASTLRSIDAERGQDSPASHLYNLRRGRTSTMIDSIQWTRDGRWVGIGSRNRTIHMFATNPYGGKTDVATHLEPGVRNIDILTPSLTDLSPVLRVRAIRPPAIDSSSPLAFTFIDHPDQIPTKPERSPNIPSPQSSPSLQPKAIPSGQFLDVLVFDPMDGSLTLRQIAVNKRPVVESSLASSVQSFGVTSISLPGLGGGGRLSSSPSTKHAPPSPVAELIAEERVLATWDLLRRRDWKEVHRPMPIHSQAAATTNTDWLAESELSTSSKSSQIVPRPIYLSHQFSFHELGEDYHALIRRLQFQLTGPKIEVRRQVEPSAYSVDKAQGSFIEGFSSPRDVRRAPSSSFDEPIASAISGSFDNTNLPTILPMYPNGIPGSQPKLFRSSIPIRTMAGIGDNVHEGIGRLRREMHKVRSPKLEPRSDSSLSMSVPLEFDEEDEDFLAASSAQEVDGSQDTYQYPALVDPPRERDLMISSTTLMDDEVIGSVDEDLWKGWDPQDRDAVREQEKFDLLSEASALDAVAPTTPQPPVVSRPTRTKRSKRR